MLSKLMSCRVMSCTLTLETICDFFKVHYFFTIKILLMNNSTDTYNVWPESNQISGNEF